MTTVEALHTLGLQPPSSHAAVKKAFKQRSKLLHPDTAGGTEAGFIELKTAYDFLQRQSAAELHFGGPPPLRRNPVRGQVVISDFPLLVLLERWLSRYYRLKNKPVIGFFVRMVSLMVRYLSTNPRQSVARKWIQLLAMLLASVTLLPLMFIFLLLALPYSALYARLKRT